MLQAVIDSCIKSITIQKRIPQGFGLLSSRKLPSCTTQSTPNGHHTSGVWITVCPPSKELAAFSGGSQFQGLFSHLLPHGEPTAERTAEDSEGRTLAVRVGVVSEMVSLETLFFVQPEDPKHQCPVKHVFKQ